MKVARTANDIKKFLGVLVQESVNAAYEEERKKQDIMSKNRLKGLNEEDPLFPDEEKSKKGKDKLDFEDLEGGDEDSGDESGGDMGGEKMGGDSGGEDFEEPTGELGGAPQAPQAEAPAAPQPAQKSYKPLELDLELGKISVDGVESMLNLMRGGRSFKDPNVSKELRKYFESLTEAEKLALATFLTAIKDIGVGQPAEKAPDPSDPDMSLTISSREKGKNIQQQSNNPQAVQQNPQGQQGAIPQGNVAQQQAPQTVRQSQDQPPEPTQMRPGELEDTTPPIVVGKRNESVSENFRNQIKELIKRSNSSI